MVQKDNGMNWQDKLRMCIEYTSIQSWKDVSVSEKSYWSKIANNMHFDARDTFIRMMIGLISSTSDICVVFAICDDFGTINEVDIERQMFSVDVVLCSKNLEEFQSTSTTCSWTILKLWFHSRGEFHSNSIIWWECLECVQWEIDFRIMNHLRQ